MDNGRKDQEQIKWEQAAAAITKIHTMLNKVDLQQFINYSELHISAIENRKDIDIPQILRQKAAVNAFREKAKVLRIAKNNLGEVASGFTKKYGKKKKRTSIKIITDGQEE